jgi:hypothetical protein
VTIEPGSKLELIEERAFYGCFSLNSVLVPASVRICAYNENVLPQVSTESSLVLYMSAWAVCDDFLCDEFITGYDQFMSDEMG